MSKRIDKPSEIKTIIKEGYVQKREAWQPTGNKDKIKVISPPTGTVNRPNSTKKD